MRGRGVVKGRRGIIKGRLARAPGSAVATLACATLCISCTDTTDAVGEVALPGIAPVDPSQLDAVVFLIGDAGGVEEGRSPLIVHLAQDVEARSADLDAGAVAVVFLGDNVYERGIRDPDHPGYAIDTLRMNTQVRVVSGPEATRKGTRALFVAGNHDWGNQVGPEGLERVRNMESHLEGMAMGAGPAAALVPTPGTPGPAVIDVGRRARILAMDGHWWLKSGDQAEKQAAMRGVVEGLSSAGDRGVVIASHLPLATGGPHGGAISFFPTLGLRYLAHKAGVLVQDLTARPYRDLVQGFHAAFTEAGPPVAYAAGHDHSLQVLEVPYDSVGRFTQLVSGAGSRLTDIRRVSGMEWGRAAPGYMRILFLKDGGAVLHVVQGAAAHMLCPEAAAGAACMEAGADSIHVAFTRRLR